MNIIPPGQMAWLPARTGYIGAEAFPAAGVGFRPSGELLLAGGGEVFAAKITPEDALILATLLTCWAEESAETAIAAADACLARVVEAAGNA